MVNGDAPMLAHPLNKVTGLQIYPAREEPVAHDELDFVVAGESGRQHDLRLSGVDRGGVDNLAVLILDIKDIVRMTGLERQRVFLNINRRRLDWSLRMTMSYWC